MKIDFSLLLFASIFFPIIMPPTTAQDDHISSKNPTFEIEQIGDDFITISNSLSPLNRIGYRFFEHEPIAWGETPLSNRLAGIDSLQITTRINEYLSRENIFIYKKEIPKDENWSNQHWTYYMASVGDGIEILLLIETFSEGLPEYYGIQQCFRLGGESNSTWRREIACAPDFSEYDVWENERTPRTSLTFVPGPEGWTELPAIKETVGARTPCGIAIDDLRTGAQPELQVGPYNARMLDPVDYGLITRCNRQKSWVCGIFWENTSHVTDHHPADCLHSIVNIGNIPPYSKKIVRGKIYWFRGSKRDLTEHYEKDFKGLYQKNKLRIASCQFPISGSIEANAAWIMEQTRRAKIQGCDLVHFPEGALSGYANADFDSFENYDWNLLWKKTDAVLSLAKNLKIWILLGSAHKLTGENKPHNSLYVINREGEIIDRYDKRFCTDGDLEFYSPGDHFTLFEINNVKCGLLICYDLRFPELFREYRKMDADVIFQSFNNSRHRIDCIHPKIMPVTAQARAGTNYFYMSLTNSSAPFGWPCYFITPDGLVAGRLDANKPGILISDVDISKEWYDASRPYRRDAINGILNSGVLVNDPRSTNRTGY